MGVRRYVAAGLAVFCSLAVRPPAADAQTRVVVGAPGSLIAVAGITVQGRGIVRRPADSARFAINVANRSQPNGALGGAEQLVAALKKAGVADATLANPTGFISANQFVTVVGTVRKPTVDAVRSLVASVSASVPDTVLIQNVNVALLLDDCAAAETAAIAAATADARERAQRFAAAAHVTLGSVLTINGVQGPASPPCPTKPDNVLANIGGGNFSELSQLAGTLDVPVGVVETVTFEIR
jgi:uncharacterized protein YggE